MLHALCVMPQYFVLYAPLHHASCSTDLSAEMEPEKSDESEQASSSSSSSTSPSPSASSSSSSVSSSFENGLASVKLYKLEELEKASNLGKYVVYLKHNPADENEPEETFLIVGQINKEPIWEKGILYLHTEDFICSEDARWAYTMLDGYFYRPLQKKEHKSVKSAENWLDVAADDVVIMGLFKEFRRSRHRSSSSSSSSFLLPYSSSSSHSLPAPFSLPEAYSLPL